MSHTDNSSVNALRVLALDMIQKANSGHPGMALDVAPALYTLFSHHLVIDPSNPKWELRDRFVLSSGHVSALLYSMLYMAGYDLSIEDLKSFRQLGSKTPGHPEYGLTSGVDATAGPLGQGIAQAVGIAMAQAHLAATYKEASFLTQRTYCLCGDGCLQEGISQEAISLAGQLGLGNLILIYDENGSTLDDPTGVSNSEDQHLRFLASNWDVIDVKDGNDIKAIDKAITKAKKNRLHPTLIVLHSHIGYGSPLEGSNKSHGSPFKAEDYEKTRKFFEADYEPFNVPHEAIAHTQALIKERLEEAKTRLEKAKEEFLSEYKEEAATYLAGLNGEFEKYLPAAPTEFKTEASRSTSGNILEAFSKTVPFLFGGSADVASSVKTDIKGVSTFSRENYEGKNIRFGIREFAMASAMNGMLLNGGVLPYVGCFLVFSDYLKPAIRMAALEHLPALYLFSHDSLAVGEDGPTHQPIEQLTMLRSIPHMHVYRPADARETWGSYYAALSYKDGPSAIILTRQNLPLLDKSSVEDVKKGAYVVYTPSKKEQVLIIATGSEVSLAVEAAKSLESEGYYIKVVSMPSIEEFEAQDYGYKAEVLSLPREKTISVEMGSTMLWGKYAKYNYGTDEFGASGKESDVLNLFGFNEEALIEYLKEVL